MTKEEIVAELKWLKESYEGESIPPFCTDEEINMYKMISKDLNTLITRIETNDKN